MPISPIVLQRRHAELGRIRLGNKGDRGQPQKLSSFRFTSPSESYIRDLAELYGGTPQPWDNNGVPGWEVYTTATSIPVYAVKGGLSQFLEYWQGGGIVHRCDGITNVLTGEQCDHDEQVKTRVRGQDVWVNPHAEAKPTTRLSVMLPELEAIGVWRMESHGWNAAAEIPAVAELAAYVGDYAPAVLHLVERRSVKDGKTSRFVVPVLDLQIGQARLREVVAAVSGGGATELAAPAETRQIEGPQDAAGADPFVPYFEELTAASSIDDLQDLWSRMVQAQLVGQQAPPSPRADEFAAAFKARAQEVKSSGAGAAEGEAAKPAPEPDADGVVDAELVDDAIRPPATSEPDPDLVWQQVVAEGGQRGWSLPDLEDDCATFLGGTTSAEASGGELTEYLEDLRKRPTEGVA